MTTPTLDQLTGHPALTAMSPLLYVAWADGDLTAQEIAKIRGATDAHLHGPERAALEAWLDPGAPPTSTELLRLHRFVKERASRLDAAARTDLVALGVAIAALEGSAVGDDEASLRALRDVEEALGVQSGEVARALFGARPPVRQDFDEPAPSFDVAALTAALDGDRVAEWARVRQLVRDPRLALPSADATKEAQRERVLEQLQVLLDEGIGALSYPEGCGGAGRKDRFIAVFEALGMHDLALVVKLGVQAGLFGGAILALGSEAQHRRWLPEVAAGRLLGGFAMTELGHGSNVRDLETVARYDADRGVFVVHCPSVSARKEWIGNAARDGRAMVVFAQLETAGERHGVHALFVPIRDEDGRLLPGVSVEDCGHKMGLNGVDNGRIWFDHVEVPRENLLDRHGSVAEDGAYSSPIPSASRRFFTMLGTLVGGRVSVAASAITASKVGLATAVRYGALRRQFGPAGEPERAVLDYPVHQQRLLPRVAATYAFHFANAALQRMSAAVGEGDDTRELEAFAAGLKALSTWQAIDSLQTARECCGGMGFLSLNRIATLRRDVDVFATFEGDNVVLLQLVAKSALAGFQKELADDLLGTLLAEVGRRAKDALITNPLQKRRTDDEHLLDEAFHRDALRFRAHNLLVSAARRIQRRVGAGMDSFDAFTEIQDHVVALAEAIVEERVHEAFADAVHAAEPAVRGPLESLRALWAIWRIEREVGWFLENDYLDARKARALRKLVGRRCAALRPDAVALVDAFGIPDEALGPIAFEGYAEHALLAQRGD